ncbi:MAG: ATP-binding protein [Caldilineaceae bacterium]
MREFNTFGPVHPQYHYHVNRVVVKAALREKIEKGRYLTLNAGRQTGKTTLFREVITELEQTEAYLGILVSFETLRGYNRSEFYRWLRQKLLDGLRGRISQPLLDWVATVELTEHNSFGLLLRNLCTQVGKAGVLIIDEFDAIEPTLAEPMLAVLREMYLARYDPSYHALQSVILVGVRNVPALLGGTQSPFNIADQFTVPYFTPTEVTELLTQHTAETGQIFQPEMMAGIFHETEGQPFLVNRLGQLLTKDIVPDPTQAITVDALNDALAQLVNENNTHFFSIRTKAALHRAEVIPALFTEARYYDFQDQVTQELLMYGILRLVTETHGIEYARIANPIYRKLLVKALAPSHTLIQQAATEIIPNRFLVQGHFHFDGLLDSFKAFMEEHGVRLLKSEATHRPLEISGQYLLLSYLTAALRSIGGYVTIEALSSAGEIDILALYREQRFIVETKIWYGKAKYEEGKTQLANYLRASGLTRGYLVVFDEKLDNNPLVPEVGQVFEVTVDEKVLRIYLIGITI